jgi:hypothetical protein
MQSKAGPRQNPAVLALSFLFATSPFENSSMKEASHDKEITKQADLQPSNRQTIKASRTKTERALMDKIS